LTDTVNLLSNRHRPEGKSSLFFRFELIRSRHKPVQRVAGFLKALGEPYTAPNHGAMLVAVNPISGWMRAMQNISCSNSSFGLFQTDPFSSYSC
jgi:hypothetical protein